MAGEKFIVAAKENSLQISLRNSLGPYGYQFIGSCGDASSLLKLIRTCQPDFIIMDMTLNVADIVQIIETIDDEALCACIIMGEYKNSTIEKLIETASTVFFCEKPFQAGVLSCIIEMAVISYKRVSRFSRQLKDMTRNYETRKRIDIAKAILMNKDCVSEDEAYGIIRKRSMDTRNSMLDVADTIIRLDEIKRQTKNKRG